MSGRAALQPALAKLVAFAAVVVVVWILGQTIGHVLLVFVVSVLIAMLLNPLVRVRRRLRIPRGLAVLMVFLGFAAAIALSIFLVIAPVRTQVEEIQRNLPAYTDQAKRQADSLQEPPVPEAAAIAVTQPAPRPEPEPGPGAGPPPAREDPTPVMDSPELRPGP